MSQPLFEVGDRVFCGSGVHQCEGMIVGVYDTNRNLTTSYSDENWPYDWHYVVRFSVTTGNYVCVNYRQNELKLKRKVDVSELAREEERAEQYGFVSE